MFQSKELFFILPDAESEPQAEGNGAKKVLILAAEEQPAQDSRAFLTKILSAANLSMATDTRLITIPADGSLAVSRLLHRYAVEKVLVFGLDPGRLGLRIEAPLYMPLHFYKIDWVFSDSLSALEPDKTRKGRLWSALKQMF